MMEPVVAMYCCMRSKKLGGASKFDGEDIIFADMSHVS